MPINTKNIVRLVDVEVFTKQKDKVRRNTSIGENCHRKILKIDRLVLNSGETLFVSGVPSCGKTMLLRIVKQNPIIVNTRLLYPVKKSSRCVSSCLLIDLEPAIMPNLNIIQNIFLPIPKSTLRLQHRVIELLHLFNFGENIRDKAVCLAHSELFKLQLIRAAILLPDLLLIDDLDLMMSKIRNELVSHVISSITDNGGAVIAAGENITEGFDTYNQITSDGFLIPTANN